ncbi:E3 ubiquitin-protein ligase At3g02290-like [Punica granatum]|uniref:E3 ubiquitin-protein ligase At3g02290-like n=2 Tax=Punica granatum TaxID=22663 RepID=A0A6P8DM58_PUNGR|nr:E3 ubiquitin-protein ligase At3g02290-like [Punica granatum]XP_031397261.1 E3 ubiquitin-protein ligase At3g02290-like [Punica granatum]PKI55349.1 hypothetical protein CRG98_024259 [Punica granatum]
MGAVCCCMQVEEIEDYLNRNSSDYRNCVCLTCFLQNFLNVYSSLFRRGDMRAIPSSIQGAASITTTASLDDSFSDMYRSPPRPLPYDADPRSFRDGFVSGREKGSSHSPEESEPLRENGPESDSMCGAAVKRKEYPHGGGPKEENLKSSAKLSVAKINSELEYVYSTTEDEDVCPTCLEEYTPENPRIMTKCSHHFHLGCIYEWMERSESCPVCGKVMLFDETT